MDEILGYLVGCLSVTIYRKILRRAKLQKINFVCTSYFVKNPSP